MGARSRLQKDADSPDEHEYQWNVKYPPDQRPYPEQNNRRQKEPKRDVIYPILRQSKANVSAPGLWNLSTHSIVFFAKKYLTILQLATMPRQPPILSVPTLLYWNESNGPIPPQYFAMVLNNSIVVCRVPSCTRHTPLSSVDINRFKQVLVLDHNPPPTTG